MLVGLGLDNGDISAKALDSLKKADHIYIERYTSTASEEYLKSIKETAGHKAEIVEIGRSDLEERSGAIVDKAKNEKVAILVPGDPLIATTHQIMLDAARKKGISIEIYHSSSIFSAAIGESGLDIYKFGPTTTIPFWKDNYKPISFIDVISRNVQQGIHTIVLMDYDQSTRSTLQLPEAIKRLLFAEKERGYSLFSSREILAMFDIGKGTARIMLARAAYLGEHAKDVKEGMLTIIVPGKMSFAEEELTSKFRVDGT